MEPGHEDREYPIDAALHTTDPCASMEPGHEDREYWDGNPIALSTFICLNGARS